MTLSLSGLIIPRILPCMVKQICPALLTWAFSPYMICVPSVYSKHLERIASSHMPPISQFFKAFADSSLVFASTQPNGKCNPAWELIVVEFCFFQVSPLSPHTSSPILLFQTGKVQGRFLKNVFLKMFSCIIFPSPVAAS